MPTDTILTFSDYRDEPVLTLKNAHLDYHAWITDRFQYYQGQEPPPVPDVREETVPAFVDCGRWLWQCGDCGGAQPVEPGEPSICLLCGRDWVDVAMPPERASIEAELLKQPGRRFHAPVRVWAPGMSAEVLQGRTAKADALRAKGVSRIRALSIGSTRTWSTGEILLAANKNTYETEVLKDLAGRNGRIDLENAIRVKTGSDSQRSQPYLDLTQDYVGLPSRTSDAAAGEGRVSYRSDTNRLRFYADGAWHDFFAFPFYATITSLQDTDRMILRDNSAGRRAKAGGAEHVRSQLSAIRENFQRFTSSGTWTKPTGVTWVYVEVIGGGGGGHKRE